MKRKVSEKKFYFENLKIYQKGLDLAINICKVAGSFPFKFSRIRDQLIGAIISVPLNIAEGTGRRSSKEKRNFYRISQSSLFECIPLLKICNELKLINKNDYIQFNQEIIELSKMLTKFSQVI